MKQHTAYAALQPLESRTLFAGPFAELDQGYGATGGGVAVPVGKPTVSQHAQPFAVADGGAIVRVNDYEYRKLDAKGKIIKSYGGGDGKLDIDSEFFGIAATAIDRKTGRVATLDDAGRITLYSSAGVQERQFRVNAASREFDLTPQLVFDNAGRVMVAFEDRLLRFNANTGTLDTSFGGGDGLVPVENKTLPAGTVIRREDEHGDGFPYALMRLFITPPGSAKDGQIVFVRQYDVARSGSELSASYLDIRRFNPDGTPLSGAAAVSTIPLNSAEMISPSRRESFGYAIALLGDIRLAADGSLTVLARYNQETLEPVGGPNAQLKDFVEFRLIRITDSITTVRNLDNLFQLPHGPNFSYDAPLMALNADGTRVTVLGNHRVAEFDTATLNRTSAFAGTGGAAQLTARMPLSGISIDTAGRVLVGAWNGRVRALTGEAVEDVNPGTAAGRATLLPDGTLSVEGTTRDDVVVITNAADKQIRVRVNQRLQTFKRADIAGIVIRTIKGNDVIDASGLTSLALGINILAGAGNDRVTGTPFRGPKNGDEAYGDTIESGSGTDTIRGGPGFDLVYGVDNADTVESAERATQFFAADEDPLF